MMLKRIFFLTALTLTFFSVKAQLNINLLGQYTFSQDVSDIWGHVDVAGNEYALVGLFEGTSIIDVTVPNSPVEVFYSPGASTFWRDLKVWNNHAYIVNEGANGLKIIDLSNLPAAITNSDVYQFTGVTYPFTKAHDLYIDENGFAYIMGSDNGVGGAIILDLNNDPKSPEEVGRYNDYYIHDGMVRGDTLRAGCVDDGFFAAIDVTTKSSPITMATHPTPNNFTHNIWPSDDGQTVFTTDEKSDAYIGAYNVSDLNNISELDRVQSSPGENVIPHNVFVYGNYLVTSYYRDGVTIHDASNPSNIIEVGNYDTSPQYSGDGFNGCWGVYPYLPSGLIIASDIENGLFILEPTYSPASYLDGKVTDLSSGSAIDGAQIELVATSVLTNTNILGNYQTGIAISGTYDVTYSKLGYQSKTITGVTLTAGNTTTLDVQLQSSVPFTLKLKMEEDSTANSLAGVQITIKNSDYSITTGSNADGEINISNFYEGTYEVYIAKWGYKQKCLLNENLSASGNIHTYQLESGYEDDFRFGLGWTTSQAADEVNGRWEREIPLGTSYNGSIPNPGNDSPLDCSEEAFVTGNDGGSAGADDVDGEVILLSPVFDLSAYTDPYIYFDRWFYNDGGTGNPNDSLIIAITNNSVIEQIDFADVNDSEVGSWASKSVQLNGLIDLTDNMQLRIRCIDQSPGHLVEAGFDNFRIIDMASVGIAQINAKTDLSIYPNPFHREMNIELRAPIELIKVEVLDLTGRLIDQREFKNTSVVRFKNEYQKGIYFLNIYLNGQLIQTEKVIKL